MKHYLITRFNLRVPEWRRMDKQGNKTLTREWMAHRWQLFNKYTLPSVVLQISQDFEWVVLFNKGTLVPVDAPYTALYLSEDWLTELQEWLLVQTTIHPWIITTRLDNDDVIDPAFMSTVREYADRREHFINFPNGTIKRGSNREAVHHLANPFMSLVETNGEPKSIYFTPHGRAMSVHAPIRQVVTKRLWTQIIHERNYINE